MAGLGRENPCWGCGQPLCSQPAEVCERAKIAAMQVEHSALRKKVAELTKPDRGLLLNAHASLGAEIARIKGILPDIEKQSRKTPPKTLIAEKEKVAQAKAQLILLTERLQDITSKHNALTERLREMKAWG